MSKLLFVFDRDNDEFLDALERKDKQGILDALDVVFGSALEDHRLDAWRYAFPDVNQSSILFGVTTAADVITTIAEQWNNAVRMDYDKAMDNYVQKWDRTLAPGNTSAEGLDNDETFKLRLAVSAMDNCFSLVGERYIYLEKENTFTTVMTDELYQYIKQNPELCVFTDVICYP